MQASNVWTMGDEADLVSHLEDSIRSGELTSNSGDDEMIDKYRQLRDASAKGTAEYAAYALIVRALEHDDPEHELRKMIANRQADCERHRRLEHCGPVQYYAREIELLKAGLVEMHEQVIAANNAERNRQRDLIRSLTDEWNNLCNLQEHYKRWPIADLQEEAKKYGAEVCKKKSEQIMNLIIAHEHRFARQIDTAEHHIQEISEEIIEFERAVSALKRSEVAQSVVIGSSEFVVFKSS